MFIPVKGDFRVGIRRTVAHVYFNGGLKSLCLNTYLGLQGRYPENSSSCAL